MTRRGIGDNAPVHFLGNCRSGRSQQTGDLDAMSVLPRDTGRLEQRPCLRRDYCFDLTQYALAASSTNRGSPIRIAWGRRETSMKPSRRRFLQLAASAPALPALCRVARAEPYPSRPVHLLVGYAAGGVNDIVARLTGQMVSERLGQQFIIEDRPGAGSNLATEAVVRASPDGYTLLEASTSNVWNATLYQNLKFDFIRDIAPVASSVKTYNVMIVNPAFPAKTVPEFIAYAKANPGKINMGSAGPGSSPHLYGELFKAMTGVDMVTVHYRGDGPAITELIAGQIQVMFGSVVTWIEQI